jgi:hypothetical protein
VHLEDVALAVALGGLQRDAGGLAAAGLATRTITATVPPLPKNW